MYDVMFSNYQNFSQKVTEMMWKCVVDQMRLGMNVMDSMAVGSNPLNALLEAKEKTRVGTAIEPDKLEKRAMERLQSGFAPPPEIYDVRNRGQIDWSKVPDWAKPVDPEVFQGCSHEG